MPQHAPRKSYCLVRRMVCGTVLMIGAEVAGIQPAFCDTPYQASDVEASCVSTTSCKFTFPAPSGKLTILHASCSVVTAKNANSDVGINYFKLFTPDTSSSQDFLQGVSTAYGTNYITQMSQVTLYFVAPGSTPVITMHALATIAAPGAIDTPTCFISGLMS